MTPIYLPLTIGYIVPTKNIYIRQTTSIKFLQITKYLDGNSNWTQLAEFDSFKLLSGQVCTPLFKKMTKNKETLVLKVIYILQWFKKLISNIKSRPLIIWSIFWYIGFIIFSVDRFNLITLLIQISSGIGLLIAV